MAIKPISELITDNEALVTDVDSLTALVSETDFKTLMTTILGSMRDMIESMSTGLRIYTYETLRLVAGDNTVEHNYSIQVLQAYIYNGEEIIYPTFKYIDKDTIEIVWIGDELEVSELFMIGILI